MATESIGQCELLIVGAGPAGCLAAYTASRLGLDVVIIDSQATYDLGHKICGSLVAKNHFDMLNKKIGLAYPKKKEIDTKISGILFKSPSGEHWFKIKREGYCLSPQVVRQRLLNDAIEQGTRFQAEVKALSPIIKQDKVIGVEVRQPSYIKSFIRAKITIDATGIEAVLRKQIPNGLFPPYFDPSGLGYYYCEYRKLKQRYTYHDYGIIHYTKRIAPGGYVWYYPRKDDQISVGISFRKLGGRLNPAEQFNRHLSPSPLIHDSEFIESGSGVVPLQKPTYVYTYPGFMMVGDCAGQVNPLFGEGLGYAMKAGYLAGTTAVSALNSGSVNLDVLWSYNHCFHVAYGRIHAVSALLSAFINSLSNTDLDFVFKNQLLKSEEIDFTSDKPLITITKLEKIWRGIKGLSRFDVSRKIMRFFDLAQKIQHQFGLYPKTFDQYAQWKAKTDMIFTEAEAAIGLKIP
ncbi:MAG: NAD(P)/FAD-dependent oxidoreductase [Candidatus Ranarchaeia archaeon]